MVSGTVGWKRKRSRRESKGVKFYRGAASTIRTRMRKKLLDPVSWFRQKENKEEEVHMEKEKSDTRYDQARHRKRKADDEEKESVHKKMKKEAKTVMFCPYTLGGALAKNLREDEADMEKITGYKIKIVEEAGEKVRDILHSSNPWRGDDCGREGCWLCRTKSELV